jgi:WD40 repeat protein
MGFKTGDTELFYWDDSGKELYRLSCNKINEHEDELQSIDILYSRGLFVTGAKDGLIKVWNIRKELIREIKFPEPITAVSFLNQRGDILVGHVGKVSSVMADDYKPFEIKELSQPSPHEVSKFINRPSREVVSDETFKKLKR